MISLKTKKNDSDFILNLLRNLSVVVASLLNKFHITPNQVTISRFILFVIPAAYLFYQGSYLDNLIGLFLIIMNGFFDLVDGDLARNYNQRSKQGLFLESILDVLILNIILLAIVLNSFVTGSPLKYLILSALFAQAMSLNITNHFKTRFNVNFLESDSFLAKQFKNKKTDVISNVIRNLIVPKNIILSLFCNFRYYLFLGVIVNQLGLLTAIYAIMINLKWLLLAISLSLYYSKIKMKNTYIFDLLHKIELKVQ